MERSGNKVGDDSAQSLFQLRRRRERSRKKLDELLSRAPDEAFLRMLWAADAIETGSDRSRAGWAWFAKRPRELVEGLRKRGFFFHKWLLETLANELLLVPKARIIPDKPNKILDCQNLAAAVQATNLLRDLENAEDGLTLRRVGVLTQMHRLGQRQFPWQRGKVTLRAFYKSSFLYAFPEAQEKFRERRGISVDDFSLVAFALYVLFQEHSSVKLPVDLRQLGIERAISDKALALLTISLSAAQTAAGKFKAASTHTSYTASVFRLSPIARFPDVLVAPIPDLIIERITEGLYYDIVTTADGSTNKDITSKLGKRFEAYCRDLLEGYLTDIQVMPEFQYGSQHSPDLMLLRNDSIVAAIECKAKKEPIAAKFGEEEGALRSSGIDELAKGIFQLWRFFSHVRRNIAAGAPEVEESAIGILLTLDTWLEASDGQRVEVLRRAVALADQNDEITEEDRRPIALCHVGDLENLLASASDQDVLRTLAIASTPERQGWLLDGLLRDLPDAVVIRKPDPFANRLADVAEWMGRFERYPASAASAAAHGS